MNMTVHVVERPMRSLAVRYVLRSSFPDCNRPLLTSPWIRHVRIRVVLRHRE